MGWPKGTDIALIAYISERNKLQINKNNIVNEACDDIDFFVCLCELYAEVVRQMHNAAREARFSLTSNALSFSASQPRDLPSARPS